jgi:hypothetical protein
MEEFHTIVLSIATIVLILILIFVGIMMQYQNAGNAWPPNSNTCPDYWEIDSTDIKGVSCIVPTTPGTLMVPAATLASGTTLSPGTTLAPEVPSTTASIGNSNTGSLSGSSLINPAITLNPGSISVINPNAQYWTTIAGTTPKCALSNWANQNSIQWNGYSNYNGCAAT